ncbi:hypothetical protein [Allorhizocola rhizosphaerae]|uniref:hypothetical protein n=1 Tax=Allorhizocola rhizosphaerae TaxID=1872709 RepID=UPI000E3D1903|nr:hypothetical protein [Allorhizocola rhizosphaerae]
MSSVSAWQRFGEGPLSRAAALVYTLIVVELMLLIAMLPGIVPLMLLDRDVSNVPLAAACAIPAGPALSAALYALHRRTSDLTELRPARAFWRGYRMNIGVLKLWIPLLVWLAIIGVNLGNRVQAGIPVWWAVLLGVIALVALAWGANALVIASLFSFRARDVARLALHFLPRTAIGVVSLLIVAAAVVALLTEAVLALLGSVFALALLRGCRSMIALITKEFTA